MKRTYICPALQVEEALAAQMLAESLAINNKIVDGSQALTKEDEAWNIWEDDEK